MSCSRCDDLRAPRLIRTPGDLAKALHVVHTNMTDGTVELIETQEFGPEGQCLDVHEGGQWKEFLRYRLKCSACQNSFDHSLCGDLSPLLGKARVDVA